MESYYAVVWGITSAAFCVLVFFLVQTSIQLRQTARSAQTLLDKLDQELDRVHLVTNLLSDITGAVGGSLGKTLLTLTGFMVRMMRRNRGKAKPSDREDFSKTSHQDPLVAPHHL